MGGGAGGGGLHDAKLFTLDYYSGRRRRQQEYERMNEAPGIMRLYDWSDPYLDSRFPLFNSCQEPHVKTSRTRPFNGVHVPRPRLLYLGGLGAA